MEKTYQDNDLWIIVKALRKLADDENEEANIRRDAERIYQETKKKMLEQSEQEFIASR